MAPSTSCRMAVRHVGFPFCSAIHFPYCFFPRSDSGSSITDLLRKVSGLCNNANQLAHVANSTGFAGRQSVDEMTRIAREVWRAVKEQW